MRRSRKWLAAPSLILALVVAACGGSDDGAADTAAPATVAPAATAAPATDAPAPTDSAPATDAPATDAPAPTEATPAEITFDKGVDETTIKVGMLADLSGIFAPLVTQIVEAQKVYWDVVNENGGIAGRQVELIIEDNGYDVPTHQEKYAALKDEVAIISQSTGSPHTASISQNLVDDELIAIPLSWYSGWLDPAIGENVYEAYTNYCMESMNAVEWMTKNKGIKTIAIVSFPGEYGQDGATGAKEAAEALGLEVVYDGEGQVTPDPSDDSGPIVQQIVASNADMVYATVNPTHLGQLMGAAVAQGYTGLWSGNSPTYNYQLLGGDLADSLDQYYFHSTYTALWNTNDDPGMKAVVDAMTTNAPELALSDTYIVGWTEGMIVETILRKAAENGDMTRAGIKAAADEVTVDFQGLAPNQTWGGDDLNDVVVRESYIYDVVKANFSAGATIGDGGGTGFEPLAGPYVGDVAKNYDFQGACFVAG